MYGGFGTGIWMVSVEKSGFVSWKMKIPVSPHLAAHQTYWLIRISKEFVWNEFFACEKNSTNTSSDFQNTKIQPPTTLLALYKWLWLHFVDFHQLHGVWRCPQWFPRSPKSSEMNELDLVLWNVPLYAINEPLRAEFRQVKDAREPSKIQWFCMIFWTEIIDFPLN